MILYLCCVNVFDLKRKHLQDLQTSALSLWVSYHRVTTEIELHIFLFLRHECSMR